MEFPKGYAQDRAEYRTHEAERKLQAFLKEFFTNIFYKVVSSVGYYLINKSTVHSTDRVQVGTSLQVSAHGNESVIRLLRTNGTETAPTAITASSIGSLYGTGYTGATYINGAAIQLAATETWNVGAQGAAINFFTTTTGGTGIHASGYIAASGSWASGIASLATNATTGFLYVPSCAGIPTGTPETITGRAAVVVDSTNNKMYIYSGGAWVALN